VLDMEIKKIKMCEQAPYHFKDILHFSECSLKKLWYNEEDELWNQYVKK